MLWKYNLHTFAAGNIFGTDFWSSCCWLWTWNTCRLSFCTLVVSLWALNTFFQWCIVISTRRTIDFSSMFGNKWHVWMKDRFQNIYNKVNMGWYDNIPISTILYENSILMSYHMKSFSKLPPVRIEARWLSLGQMYWKRTSSILNSFDLARK